jgi:hypothetical protein
MVREVEKYSLLNCLVAHHSGSGISESHDNHETTTEEEESETTMLVSLLESISIMVAVKKGNELSFVVLGLDGECVQEGIEIEIKAKGNERLMKGSMHIYSCRPKEGGCQKL